MPDAPPSEVDVDEQLVARLIKTQHPDLAGRLELVANGWDNLVFRLGSAHAVRIPRRAVAVPLLLHEIRALPLLAPRLSVPIPTPVRVGEPGEGYPWPWTIVPWFEGELAASVERSPLVEPLARFVREVHLPAPADAPRNPVRGGPLATRTDATLERMRIARLSARHFELWEESLAAPVWAGPPVWLHGDLHPANVLVRDGAIAAVIDFGDVTSGDPASDLGAAWMFFRAEDRARFQSLLDYDDDTWLRARGWALSVATAVLVHSPDHPQLGPVMRDVLTQLVE